MGSPMHMGPQATDVWQYAVQKTPSCCTGGIWKSFRQLLDFIFFFLTKRLYLVSKDFL